ncbi:MAG: CHAP domain-containing protein [Spirochaetaceae bacterium]|nr:MAG: CHAP domain-containing protein [Spirochaetaceae bacterium]
MIGGCASGLNLPSWDVQFPDARLEQASATEVASWRSHTNAAALGLLKEPGPKQTAIVAAGYDLVGARRLKIEGRVYPLDCSGTILAVYHHAGMDLQSAFAQYSGNGVSRLYRMAADKGLLASTGEQPGRYPAPGDIIFWDNTYDRSRSGRWDDPLTHAAIVLEVYENGAIEYLHYHYTRGIVIEHMNLLEPEVHTTSTAAGTVVVNSPMRMRRDRYIQPESWLASHLYRDAGALYRGDW